MPAHEPLSEARPRRDRRDVASINRATAGRARDSPGGWRLRRSVRLWPSGAGADGRRRMSRYLIRRILGAIVVMWAVATLVFFMLRAVPGDPIAAMLFDVGDPAAADAIRKKFGLDQPVWVQYLKWFALVLQGDLGTSLLG